ncbi:hypothetical protein SAMN05660284_00403 [Formivibrio citricus]|uniref:Chemotaxis protein CheX n=1 Tax=Formivibrio citricus TaxID=83765 RepID=A0A1I4VV57_9NEIS|nr:hypothetical protein [Formivibrio citricus]SFN05171.1 hypothetical protein SAMN05660284_00403 [Formivibrio citricus]
MIGANAGVALEKLFERAILDNAATGAEQRCAVARNHGVAVQDKAANRPLVVLNISSYLFRIVALFEFGTDARAIEQLARATRSPAKLEGQALRDACAEFANMLCGAVNRSLCKQFRHVGMSTPFVLENTCAQYLAMLEPSLTQSFTVSVDGAEWFGLTVCTCTADGIALDFSADEVVQEEAMSGELEFF